jgi:hypothetical protein
MLERTVQAMTATEPSTAQATRSYRVWRPSLERDPEFNPFSNVVDRLTRDQDADHSR